VVWGGPSPRRWLSRLARATGGKAGPAQKNACPCRVCCGPHLLSAGPVQSKACRVPGDRTCGEQLVDVLQESVILDVGICHQEADRLPLNASLAEEALQS
jgi:hypothetical protein